MATLEEIEHRVAENDTAATAKRSAAAKRVGELAQLRADVAEQLSDVERELGDVLAESNDVIGMDELAKFTDVPIADLDRWLNGRKTARTKRKKPTSSAAKTEARQGLPTAPTKASGPAPAGPEVAKPRSAAAGVPVEVT